MTLFVDMDGTLAEYRNVPLKALYEPGYFLSLKPNRNVVSGLDQFMREHPEINVAVLSCILTDRKQAKEEKAVWLERNCPFLCGCEWHFIPCGSNKKDVAADNINYLLDDYSRNIIDFDDGAKNYGIKLLNGINGKGLQWTSSRRIESSLSPELFAKKLYSFMEEHKDA